MRPDRLFFDRLADAAGKETLPRFRSGTGIVNKEAGGFDPVTEGDRAAEAAIRALIGDTFPDHGILGEEYGSTGLERDHVWVIDPIDGTRAFISGVPMWGTLIGLYHKGRAVMGLMDQPFTGERYFADGEGAVYRGPEGERRLRSSAVTALADAILFSTSPHLHKGEARQRFDALRHQVRLTRYGCDCYAFALLAAGHVDLVVESGVQAYDVGGLIPIVEQAGGVFTDWSGGRAEMGGNVVAAANPALHAAALAVLSG
ncbi:histidinol-phosphatase [Ensifer soli]|uniref:histidinol-phosphatase n=1 Tax=Ciceribacter sp. sgz301302 TaxID=3342379 RepID=UPI0035BA596A